MADAPHLVALATTLAAEAEQSFGHLSVRQLNSKPHPEQWSVGQCLHHLVTSNSTYFPIFEKIIAGEKGATLWERRGDPPAPL